MQTFDQIVVYYHKSEDIRCFPCPSSDFQNFFLFFFFFLSPFSFSKTSPGKGIYLEFTFYLSLSLRQYLEAEWLIGKSLVPVSLKELGEGRQELVEAHAFQDR